MGEEGGEKRQKENTQMCRSTATGSNDDDDDDDDDNATDSNAILRAGREKP